MKLFKTKLLASALVLTAAMSIGGCDKPTPDPGPVTPPEPDNAVVMPKAQAVYMGDFNKAGSACINVALHTQGLEFVEDDWSFTGSGDMLWLEMNAEIPDNQRQPELASGTYLAESYGESFAKFTFGNGDESGLGSFFATVVDGVETRDKVVGGTVVVSRTADKYKVIAQIKTESGKELAYKFENTMPFMISGVPIPPEEFDGEFLNARADYFADEYKVEYGNVMFTLSDLNQNGADGHELGLDLNVALFTSQKDIKIAPGTYKIDNSQTYNKPFTFNAGRVDGEYIVGSYWVDIDTEGQYADVLTVIGGECKIAIDGDNYVVTVNVDLIGGENRQGTYRGAIKTVDQSCLSRIEGDVALNNFTQGMMVYRGEEYYSNGSVNWAVMLGTAGVDLSKSTGVGDVMQLDLNVPTADSTKLPVGTFEVIEKFTTESVIPWSYVPGHYSSNAGIMRGTWYRKDFSFSAPGVKGTITVAKSGDNYTVSFDLKDDYYYLPNKNTISGSYTGELTFLDARQSQQEVAPYSLTPQSKQHKQAKQIRRFAR